MWPCSPQHDDVQLVRSVNAAYQRAHVGGGAGAGDEDEIARQAFAVEHVGAEEISWLRHNRFRRDHGNLQRRQQANHSGAFVADIYANRAGAHYSRKSFGDADCGVDQLIGSSISHNPRILGKIAEQRNRQVMRRGVENPLRVSGGAQDGVAQSRGRTVDDLHRGDSFYRRVGELLDQRDLLHYWLHNHRSLYLAANKRHGHSSHNLVRCDHLFVQALYQPGSSNWDEGLSEVGETRPRLWFRRQDPLTAKLGNRTLVARMASLRAPVGLKPEQKCIL